MLSMSGSLTVPRRSTLGMSACMDAVSASSWLSSDMVRVPVLNLSVRSAVSHTPGSSSSRVYSICPSPSLPFLISEL